LHFRMIIDIHIFWFTSLFFSFQIQQIENTWNINKLCVQINGKLLMAKNKKPTLKIITILSSNIIESTLVSRATMQYLHQCINKLLGQSFGFAIPSLWYCKPIGQFLLIQCIRSGNAHPLLIYFGSIIPSLG
jgi:hypothetical protein